MANVGENLDWISDYIIAILKAPTWVAPIANFIDGHCGIFDDQEENKLEYTLVHNAFNKLVDDLLTAHLAELSVTTDQFMRFCQQGLTGESEVHRDLVEQLVSVEDFLVFKAMMVQRSAYLNREALAGREHLPEATPYGAETYVGPSGDTDAERIEALRIEAEQLDLERRCLEAELHLMVALSMQLEQRLQLTQALNEMVEAVARMEALAAAAAAAEEPAVADPQPAVAPAVLPPLRTRPHQPAEWISPTVRVQPLREASSEVGATETAKTTVPTTDSNRGDPGRSTALAHPTSATTAQRSEEERTSRATSATTADPSEEERKARAEHLKRQRELLLAKKKRDRESQLSAYEQSHGSSTATRAAERACVNAGKRLAAELSGASAPAAALPDPEAAAVQMRKTLARQLKQTLTGSLRGSP